jgi:phage shock protein PspC (stress-responsive transcriptional regulator)
MSGFDFDENLSNFPRTLTTSVLANRQMTSGQEILRISKAFSPNRWPYTGPFAFDHSTHHMSQERYRRRSSIVEEFDTSLMYDDIEKIREREEEEEKDQNGKIGSAGLMAFIAGAALLITGVISQQIGAFPQLMEFLTSFGLPIIGFGALGYGFYKTMKLAFRQKELNFPALNVYRKTKPAPAGANRERDRERDREREREREEETINQDRAKARYRQRTYRRPSQRKVLRRSRSNRVFSGVSGGIAEYAGISAALIRFAFIAGLFMTGGMSIFVYLLFSIVLPANYDQFEEPQTRRPSNATGNSFP